MNSSEDLQMEDSFLSGNCTIASSKGSKRKLDLLHISPSKRVNTEDSISFSSSPVMESTVVENQQKTNTETLREEENTTKSKSEEKLSREVDFLKALLKTKEDIISETESHRTFLEKKVTNLERFISEKETFIVKLKENVQYLSSKFAQLSSSKNDASNPPQKTNLPMKKPRQNVKTTEGMRRKSLR